MIAKNLTLIFTSSKSKLTGKSSKKYVLARVDELLEGPTTCDIADTTRIEASSKMRLEIWRRAMLLHCGKQPAMDLAKQVQGDLHFSCFSQENNSDDRDHTEVPIGAVPANSSA